MLEYSDGAILDGFHALAKLQQDGAESLSIDASAAALMVEGERRGLQFFNHRGELVHGADLEAINSAEDVAEAMSAVVAARPAEPETLTPAPGVSVHGVPGRTAEETTVEATPVAAFGVQLEKLLADSPGRIEVLPAPDPAAAAGDALAALARALPGLAELGIAVEITISTRGN